MFERANINPEELKKPGESKLKKPKLASGLRLYEKEGGYFKATEEEFKKKGEEIKQARTMKKGQERVKQALEKGEVSFGEAQSQKKQQKGDNKISFDEFKSQQEAHFQETVEEARRKKIKK